MDWKERGKELWSRTQRVRSWSKRELSLLGLVLLLVLCLLVAVPATLFVRLGGINSLHPEIRFQYSIELQMGSSAVKTQALRVVERVLFLPSEVVALSKRYPTHSRTVEGGELRGSYGGFSALLDKVPVDHRAMGYGGDVLLELSPDEDLSLTKAAASELRLEYAVQGFRVEEQGRREEFVLPLSLAYNGAKFAVVTVRLRMPEVLGLQRGAEEEVLTLLTAVDGEDKPLQVADFKLTDFSQNQLWFETTRPIPTAQKYYLRLAF